MFSREDFFENIRKNVEQFSPLKRKIAHYILANYHKAAFLTAREIGETCSVSESTVNRFSRDLGYTGFPEFIKNLKGIVHAELSGDKRLELLDAIDGANGLEYLHRLIHDEINNLRELSRLDTGVFQQFVELIINAERIVITGSRFSSIVARHLYYGLYKLKDNVVYIEHIDSTAYDRLEFFDESTLIIAIGLGRYPREVLEFLEAGKNNNIRIAAITDSPIAPFVKLSDATLIAPVEVESYVGTVSAPGCLVVALLSEISFKTKEASMTRLKRLEQIARKRGYYM